MSMTAGEVRARREARVVILSSSLLTERMFRYSSFRDGWAGAASRAAHLWTTAMERTAERRMEAPLVIEPFPEVRPFREFPYNYLRRLNEYAWDFDRRPPSRLSMMRHVRDHQLRRVILALKGPARIVAALGLAPELEWGLERLLLSYERSAEAVRRLRELKPDLLVTTGTFRYEEPAIVAAARQLGIPVLALITSWDNPSTKNRMVFRYDGYLVWSEQMRRDMHHFFPQSRQVPFFITGAPQFDVFFDREFVQSREDFARQHGLDPGRPIILYALGSPNLFDEIPAVRHLAESIVAGQLGDVQLLVRPHPVHTDGSEMARLAALGPRVVVQLPKSVAGRPAAGAERAQDRGQIFDWVNTFRHAAVVVNLSSTAAIDGAILDKPIVNLDFDPGGVRQQMVKEINHEWTHFKPIAESGALRLVNDAAEMVGAVRAALADPDEGREARRRIAGFVCGPLDGQAGARTARAILEFARRPQQTSVREE